MRISDWSSDVCSSDLIALNVGPRNESGVTKGPGWRAPSPATSGSRPLFVDALRLAPLARGGVAEIAGAEERVERLRDAGEIGVHALCDRARHVGPDRRDQPHRDRTRSEERRVGKEWGRTWRSRGLQYHEKKK